MYLQTPNLQIEPLRDQAATYGVDTTAIETLLNHAASQNYTYLIKRPTNQYQVILELDDQFRTEASDLNKLYIKSADGLRVVPFNAVAKWHESIGATGRQPHQPVHQRHVRVHAHARRPAGAR